MLRNMLLAGTALLLGGCLTTPKPVFDETNSLPVAEIPQFVAFVDNWESFVGSDDSPRELIAQGGRGVLVNGILVVQERNEYYALTVVAGRPLACVIYADDSIEKAAAAHGVTVEVERSEEAQRDVLTPVPVEAAGPPEALMAFIQDQFANQSLAYNMPKRGGS